MTPYDTTKDIYKRAAEQKNREAANLDNPDTLDCPNCGGTMTHLAGYGINADHYVCNNTADCGYQENR